jgi:HAD superfamily hydrolase (TIGR01509 family)
MMFRLAIVLSFLASSGVVAFAPLTPATSVISNQVLARPSFASSLKLSAPASEATAESSTSNKKYDFALLFDCDGVILETEELHRLAYNAAFQEFGVTKVCGDLSEPVDWSVGYYDILQNSIGGGKPKMRHYFSQMMRFESNENGDPTTVVATIPGAGGEEQQAPKKKKKKGSKKKTNGGGTIVTIGAGDIATGLESLIDSIQTLKTELYKKTVEETAIPRPGLLNLMDEALADDSIAVGVCSASTKAAAQKVLECALGPGRVEKLDVCILGDDVSEKKPSPMIYNAAREKLGIDSPTKCVVVEDSAVGLRAAKAAGMRCLITYTASTTKEDFYGMGADAKVPDLVNGGNQVTLESIFSPLRKAFSAENSGQDQSPELLVGFKDDAVVEEDEELYDDDDNLIEVTSGDVPPSAVSTLEPSPEEAAAFAASEADVGAQNLEKASDAIGKELLPVTLSKSPEEQAFFSSAEAEVDAATGDESTEADEQTDGSPAEEESSPKESTEDSAEPSSDEPEAEEPPSEEDASTEESPATPAPETTTTQPSRILKPKLVQDEMGNWSM